MSMVNPSYPVYPGLHIAIEGIDGSGKTAVAKALCQTLNEQGSQSIFIRLPGGSDFAEEHRHACLNVDVSKEVQTLFYSSLIVDGMQKVAVPALKEGKTVIADRSFGTTFCYQGMAQDNHEMVVSVIKSCRYIARPDLTLYLNLPLNTALTRESGEGRSVDRYSRMQRVNKERIKEVYDLLYTTVSETKHFEADAGLEVKLWHAREMITKSTAIIDATKSPLEVLTQCRKAISDYIRNTKG